MQYVKDVLEQLKRFSPDAVMNKEIVFESCSPSTSCIVRIPSTEKAKHPMDEFDDDDED